MIKKDLVKDLGIVVLGNIILAIGVAFFLVPNAILSGGVAGIAIAIEPIVHLHPNTMIYILTICLFIIGAIFLGKGFMIKTALSSVLYPTFVSLFGEMAEKVYITDDPLLASIYGGIFIGFGLGLVFRTGASTGGMDIPPLIIHKYTHIPVHTLVLIVDGLTVLLGMAIHGIEPALIGIISVWVSSYMVNKAMMIGLREAQSIMIISEKYEEILDEISKNLDRGATLIDAKGVYTRQERPVIMVVIFRKQFPILNRIVQAIDPSAFVIVYDVNEVQGEGFTFDELDNGGSYEI
ncbi:uncharacterized membrane-anchored protein YitT (DUF2179 family) [Breznakia sp. PF5-3]|uniref:YitT family protein n=1 Tax=unclassified Breznakia TaxID=2623764 RepID=UPI002406DD94|nr:MULTISPECIES: YitT family protein [unclassified Breznakia]MDF9824563.1 uncharacterized membrane-anchored protein YitT (DUF2179 family) [Breznakia sp. PM6-1]MDF9835453.1 uncharacterized membrane-anchored protein YitT (DUF2179 family) [Breznakia sp. PF5-3]MDF9837863.1 uncharacterized membrane-anchored protein YitT (DUF2179 family) [Breznakia sp. PFB2-8]MDF9859844.1 uncharacterized membrane-anchored protein YitT (DUF2179 family) [Breznakia sp. PH5-24]